jgi:hypothetical protein
MPPLTISHWWLCFPKTADPEKPKVNEDWTWKPVHNRAYSCLLQLRVPFWTSLVELQEGWGWLSHSQRTRESSSSQATSESTPCTSEVALILAPCVSPKQHTGPEKTLLDKERFSVKFLGNDLAEWTWLAVQQLKKKNPQKHHWLGLFA